MFSSWTDTTPQTTFPLGSHLVSATNTDLSVESLDDQILSLLVNSDPSACNENLSIFLKFIVDNVYLAASDEDQELVDTTTRSYHNISKYALKLLTSNLFIKNYQFCVGKILAFLEAFNAMTDLTETECTTDRVGYETECFKEFLCIILLLLLKVKNTDQVTDSNCQALDSIDSKALFATLREYNFVLNISSFITNHVVATNRGKSSFILLKFGCDVFFEYLYHIELLNDAEFHSLTQQSKLIPTVIKYLLSNDNFDNYDINGDDFEDEAKLIAYEEFKLLLLINEQYLMKCYSSKDMKNEVFEGLMRVHENTQVNHANIAGFINLLIYHLNREESQIIKILILKFLYLVFTTSYTSRLVYLNDLKILVDIFIRELNNLDYTTNNDNRIILLAYLKVIFPLLVFSQLKESLYKQSEIVDILSNIVLHSSSNDDISHEEQKHREGIIKLTEKCMSIDWIKEKKEKKFYQATPRPSSATNLPNSSNSANHSTSSLQPPKEQEQASFVKQKSVSPTDAAIELYEGGLNNSSESLGSFARIASVRSSSRRDFYRHTTARNQSKKQSMYYENNNNMFMQAKPISIHPSISRTVSSESSRSGSPSERNILDLPSEYLKSKPLPKLPTHKEGPEVVRVYKEASPAGSVSSLVIKALKKKAPPPPPHHAHLISPTVGTPTSSRTVSCSSSPNSTPHTSNSTPPPPPPPRRRR